jgi:hypothetical protein
MNNTLTLVDSHKGRILLNEAAYRLISENAPEELPIYVETRDHYLANPEGFTQQKVDEDEVLGIGEVAAVKTFTKVVFPIIGPMLEYLVEKVTEAFQEELGEEAVEWVRGLFSPKVQPQPIFSQYELDVIVATIDNIANTEAKRLGLEANQVLTVRDAVITKLVLAKK